MRLNLLRVVVALHASRSVMFSAHNLLAPLDIMLPKAPSRFDGTPLQLAFDGVWDGVSDLKHVEDLKELVKEQTKNYNDPAPIFLDQCYAALGKMHDDVPDDVRIDRAQIAYGIILFQLYADMYARLHKTTYASAYNWDENFANMLLALLSGWTHNYSYISLMSTRPINPTYKTPTLKTYTIGQICSITAWSYIADWFDSSYTKFFEHLKYHARKNMTTNQWQKHSRSNVDDAIKATTQALDAAMTVIVDSSGFYTKMDVPFIQDAKYNGGTHIEGSFEPLSDNQWLTFYNYLYVITLHTLLAELTVTSRSKILLNDNASSMYFLGNLGLAGTTATRFFQTTGNFDVTPPVLAIAKDMFDD